MILRFIVLLFLLCELYHFNLLISWCLISKTTCLFGVDGFFGCCCYCFLYVNFVFVFQLENSATRP